MSLFSLKFNIYRGTLEPIYPPNYNMKDCNLFPTLDLPIMSITNEDRMTTMDAYLSLSSGFCK